MKLKKSYNTEILLVSVVLLIGIVSFSLVIPFDTLWKSKGLLTSLVVVIFFILSVIFAFLLGYFLSKNDQGKPVSFKEFNGGVTFSVKVIEKKEVNKSNAFLDEISSKYLVLYRDEAFLLMDSRIIPEGDYIKDIQTGRIRRFDSDTKELNS